MKFKIQIVFSDSDGQTRIEDVTQLEKNSGQGYSARLSLQEPKKLLKIVQKKWFFIK